LEVAGGGAALDVLEVERELGGKHGVAIAALGVVVGGEDALLIAVDESGEVGDPGADAMDGAPDGVGGVDEAGDLGAGADEAHVAAEDVPELRQLVELVL